MADATQVYQVKTEAFEGPLDLLLSLIEKRKLFVSDISLSQVTDDYIQHVNNLPERHLRDISIFIVVAATLILIKSKSLLPLLQLTEEEESDIEDLELRLFMYKKIKEVGEQIKKQFGRNIIFEKSFVKPDLEVFAPDRRITKNSMHTSILEALDRIPKKEKLPEVRIMKTIKIEDVITNLVDRIQEGIQMSFREFSAGGTGTSKEKKVYAIVSFLAMLELVRQGLCDASQHVHFEDIQISKSASPDSSLD